MRWVCLLTRCRDILREQHQLSEEIGAAITSVPLGEQPDEEDLDAELEGLEQEAMDERMLNTGPVPVNTQLDRLPAAGTSDREYPSLPWQIQQKILTPNSKQRQGKTSRRRRRGSRAGQAARGNGHVARPSLLAHMFFLARICTPQFLVLAGSVSPRMHWMFLASKHSSSQALVVLYTFQYGSHLSSTYLIFPLHSTPVEWWALF